MHIKMSVLWTSFATCSSFCFRNGLPFTNVRFFIRSVATALRENNSEVNEVIQYSDEAKTHNGTLSSREEVELKIEGLTNLGDGVGKVSGNWVVMVSGAIPGELVRAEIFRNHKNYSEASLVEVLEPSSHRVQPKCVLYGYCGGCQYQHIALDFQREWKRQQVLDVFWRIGGIRDVNVYPVRGTENGYGYRSKLTPHYDTLPKTSNGEIKAIGFQKRPFPMLYYNASQLQVPRGKIIDVEYCPIAVDSINNVLPVFREAVKEKIRQHYTSDASPKRQKGATLFLREADEGVVTDPRKVVSASVNGRTFKFIAGEFFQNNLYVLPQLVDHVIDEASQNSSVKYLIDAYCGGGLFSLCASKKFEQCVGIEVSSVAVKYANENARFNNISNCSFFKGNSSEIFVHCHFNPSETAVVVDPPRRGCDEIFLNQLLQYGPRKIVYVSCDPATQARDSRRLVEGGYKVLKVVPFDLFPQTRHIESVATFER